MFDKGDSNGKDAILNPIEDIYDKINNSYDIDNTEVLPMCPALSQALSALDYVFHNGIGGNSATYLSKYFAKWKAMKLKPQANDRFCNVINYRIE